MTGASDDEVLKVFKAMKPEDGIVVKKDGDDISVDLGDDEYIIKLDSEESEAPVADEFGDDSEEAPELGEEKNNHLIGKLIGYLVTDFVKANSENNLKNP